jgi:hypothetical protein
MSTLGLAFVTFTVPSRVTVFFRNLAGRAFQAFGMQLPLITCFSTFALRCLGVAISLAKSHRSPRECREFRVWLGQYGKEGDIPWPDARNPGSPMASSTSC